MLVRGSSMDLPCATSNLSAWKRGITCIRPIAPPSLCAIGLNLDSTAITAMINSGSTPITLPSRYAVPTSSRVASSEMRYLLATALATASISRSAGATERCQVRSGALLRGETAMIAAADAGSLATTPSSRADDVETMATSTTANMANMANTPAGAPRDFANRLRIAVLSPAEGKLFGIENLWMLSRRATALQRESLAAEWPARGLRCLSFDPFSRRGTLHGPHRLNRLVQRPRFAPALLAAARSPGAAANAKVSLRHPAELGMLQCTDVTLRAKWPAVKEILLQCNNPWNPRTASPGGYLRVAAVT